MQKEAVNINQPDALIFQTGIGGSRTIQTLQWLNIKDTDRIINIGYAGSTYYKPGEIKTVSQVQKLHPSVTVKDPVINLKPINSLEAVTCYTADSFYENEEKKEVPLVDMELYYISLIYPQVQSIKIVSDNAHYQSYKTFNSQNAWAEVNDILYKISNE